METKFNENEVLDLYNEEVKFSIEDIRDNISKWMSTLEDRERQNKFIKFISSKFNEVEQHDKVVKSVYVSAKVFAILRTFGKDYFEEASRKEVVDKGIYGRIWTASIIVRSNIGDNIILSEKEFDVDSD